jgi:hypothetical protein
MREIRILLGFTLAPLAAPLIVLIAQPNPLLVGAALMSAYFNMFVFGIPVFLLIRRTRATAWWLAPPVVFVCGLAAWFVTGALFALLLDEGIDGVIFTLHDPAWRSGAIWPAAVSGAATASAFWLIGRPDRA